MASKKDGQLLSGNQDDTPPTPVLFPSNRPQDDQTTPNRVLGNQPGADEIRRLDNGKALNHLDLLLTYARSQQNTIVLHGGKHGPTTWKEIFLAYCIYSGVLDAIQEFNHLFRAKGLGNSVTYFQNHFDKNKAWRLHDVTVNFLLEEGEDYSEKAHIVLEKCKEIDPQIFETSPGHNKHNNNNHTN